MEQRRENEDDREVIKNAHLTAQHTHLLPPPPSQPFVVSCWQPQKPIAPQYWPLRRPKKKKPLCRWLCDPAGKQKQKQTRGSPLSILSPHYSPTPPRQCKPLCCCWFCSRLPHPHPQWLPSLHRPDGTANTLESCRWRRCAEAACWRARGWRPIS